MLRQASGQDTALFPRSRAGLSPFGVLLRSARCSKGLTQQALCGKLGVRSTYICELERGGISICEKELDAVALALGMEKSPADWIEALIEGGQMKQTA